MPRKHLIRDAFFPYHVTNKTREGRFYSLPMDEIWSLYEDQLRIVSWAYGAKIHAFVLMSNHYHLLMSTPDANIDEIVQFFQSQISAELFNRTHSKNYCFQTRYRWTLIKDKSYYYNAYRYVYQNPMRAKLCSSVAEYPYSTFHGRAGYSTLNIPIHEHPYEKELDLNNIDTEEVWINDLLENDQLVLIKKGLRRFNFQLPKKEKANLKHYLSKR